MEIEEKRREIRKSLSSKNPTSIRFLPVSPLTTAVRSMRSSTRLCSRQALHNPRNRANILLSRQHLRRGRSTKRIRTARRRRFGRQVARAIAARKDILHTRKRRLPRRIPHRRRAMALAQHDAARARVAPHRRLSRQRLGSLGLRRAYTSAAAGGGGDSRSSSSGGRDRGREC